MIPRLVFAFVLFVGTSLFAAPPTIHPTDPELAYLPQQYRVQFRNPDGSCVQCSIGMIGLYHNVPAAEKLLWDSPYGPKVRGGSWPGRVRNYMADRNIQGWNITGQDTVKWIEWAMKTGRHVALTFKSSHFCTLMAMSPDGQYFYVCDNNTPYKVDKYTRSQFMRLHHYPNGWCVILDSPPPTPTPLYVRYW